MTADDAKKFRGIIKEELEPVKKDLRELRGDVDIVKKDVKELREDVDALRGDVFTLQEDVTGIRDEIGLWHGRDKREIDELKTHLGLPLMPDTPEV